jgi:hypothetical protein
VENRSEVDFAIVETIDAGPAGSARVQACSGMAVSEELPGLSWAVEVGLARDGRGGISGSVLARFDASQLRGVGPYFVSVVIDPDETVTIEQRAELPSDPARKLC